MPSREKEMLLRAMAHREQQYGYVQVESYRQRLRRMATELSPSRH